ncbi:MAG TPA: winged helix-turn-helix domain-containing protein [Candidatus Angelobacter sp.]|nr:winged helix-turn-helix domain-containing protein [Candidatus Angelobacter sp.]
MKDPLQRPRALRFEIFEMDLDSEELKKNGLKLKLRCQPFRMLATIAEHNGNVVTYEELRTQFWPTVSIDNYKHSLGNSMLEIRKVLGDSANNPHYIETVSRGYRFLMPVEFIPRTSTNGNGSSNSLTDGFPAEIKQIREELLNTSACRGLALLLCRCKSLCNQHPQDPNLPELQLLMAHIQSAIDRSAVLEPGWANPAISDEVASLVFDDLNAITIPHRFGNGRWKTIGLASESVLLVVEHSVRRENGQQVIVIHSARRATPQERRVYEQTRK